MEIAFGKKSDKFDTTISDTCWKNRRLSYMIFVACVGKCFQGKLQSVLCRVVFFLQKKFVFDFFITVLV
jgi:hypothetical protein